MSRESNPLTGVLGDKLIILVKGIYRLDKSIINK